MLVSKSKCKVNEVTGISVSEKQRIIDFLQGAVYCWCKNRKNEWFSARDLLGGENYHWEGTPMIVLHRKHNSKGKNHDESVKYAGIDAGWLLKKVIELDKRNFETKEEELIRKYRWKK